MRSTEVGLAAALAALAVAGAGCAGAHQCRIPDAPIPAAAAPPLPVHVGVRYAPGLPERSLVLRMFESSWTLPVGAASVSAFNRAAAQLFATVSDASPAEGGPDAVLTVSVDDVRIRPGPFRPERCEVTCTAVLADRAGVELGRASATAAADGAPVHAMGLFHCDASGSATGEAMARAAAQIRDALAASAGVQGWAKEHARPAATAAAAPDGSGPDGSGPDPAAAPPPPPPPLVTPPQPAERVRRHRPAAVPRYLGADLVHGTIRSSAPGIGTRRGVGWGVSFGWDVSEHVELGFRGGVTNIRVGWTPDPADTDSGAESGFFGPLVVVRLRPGRLVDPWIAAELAYQAVTWNSYFHDLAGWGLMGSAGVDLRVVSFGAVRAGVNYSAFTARTSSIYGPGVPPQPWDDGARASMKNLWLSIGWVFDFGAAR